MKNEKSISDLDGFCDICNETELFAVEAGCSEGPKGASSGGPISISGKGGPVITNNPISN